MEKEELRTRIYSKIDQVPTLPAVFPKIMRLMEDDMASGTDVADTISRDPALASRILKVANSAYYGFPQKIASVDRAITLLGFNMVKSLALSIGVMHSLPSGVFSSHFSEEGLWTHSLTVATAMERLGGKSQFFQPRDHVFLVGLLHDIGKVVLVEFFRESFLEALEEAQRVEAAPLHVVERRLLGFDHGEVGAMLLSRWKLPPVISEPIAVHHGEHFPEGIDRSDVAVLRVADALSQNLGLGQREILKPLEIREEDLEVLAVGEQELEGVKAHLEGAREEIGEFFRAMC